MNSKKELFVNENEEQDKKNNNEKTLCDISIKQKVYE